MALKNVRGSIKEGQMKIFTEPCSERIMGNSFQLKKDKFGLGMRKTFFYKSGEALASPLRLPRTAVDAPSLEVQDQIGWCCQHPGLVESAPACHGG